MKLNDKVAVVTGGGRGIGRALARKFASEGARVVVVADLDAAAAASVAKEIGGLAVKTNVAEESDVAALVAHVDEQFGRIDLFCSNAGILVDGGVETSNDDWLASWNVNTMAHVYAARAVLPGMVERGEGYLLNVVSAAGLLTQIGSATYAVTKHAARAFAEWVAMTYGDAGIKVSCVCPQGVRTRLLDRAKSLHFLAETALSPDQVADAVIEGLDREQFMILPHPEVAGYFQSKAENYDRWLGGMRKLRRAVEG